MTDSFLTLTVILALFVTLIMFVTLTLFMTYMSQIDSISELFDAVEHQEMEAAKDLIDNNALDINRSVLLDRQHSSRHHRSVLLDRQHSSRHQQVSVT